MLFTIFALFFSFCPALAVISDTMRLSHNIAVSFYVENPAFDINI